MVFSMMSLIALLGFQSIRNFPNQLGFVLGYASDITVDQTLVLTNQERGKSGLGSLTLNAKLSSAASAKANDMFQNQYWAHVSPAGKEPWAFITASGYSYRVAGENLARDFNHTTDMVVAWMNSPSHKANIMNGRYTEIGLAVMNGQLQGVDTTLVVQMFGSPTTGQTPQLTQAPPSNEAPAQSPEQVAPTTTASPSVVIQTTVEPSQITPTQPSVFVQGQTKLEPPRTEVLARQTMPTGSLRSLGHINPLSIMKSFFVTILTVLVVTLVYDLYAIGHYHSLRIVGKNLAHILFFATVVFLLIFFKSGAII